MCGGPEVRTCQWIPNARALDVISTPYFQVQVTAGNSFVSFK